MTMFTLEIRCQAIEAICGFQEIIGFGINVISSEFQHMVLAYKTVSGIYKLEVLSEFDTFEETENAFRKGLNYIRSGGTLSTDEIISRMVADDDILVTDFYRKIKQLKAHFNKIFFIAHNGVEGVLTTNVDATVDNMVEAARVDAQSVYQEYTEEEEEDYRNYLYSTVRTLDELLPSKNGND